MGFKLSSKTPIDKKILYVDMDNVLVDFQSGLNRMPQAIKEEYADDGKGKPHYDDIPHIFSLMDPIPGAIEAMKLLVNYYDIYILSTAPWRNPTAWSDKLEWVKKYLDFTLPCDSHPYFEKRLIISHHKDLNKGDYLIDDRPNNGAQDFKGKWLHFKDQDGHGDFMNWREVITYLIQKDDLPIDPNILVL